METEPWLMRAARHHSGRVAIETPAARLDYAGLAAAAGAAAGALTARGAGRGTPVAVALPPGLDFAIALHAGLLIGAPVVPVDLRLNTRERAAVVGDALLVDEPLPRSGMAPAPVPLDLEAVAAIVNTSGTTATARPVELTYRNWLWSALGSATALGVDPAERWLCVLPLAHVGGLSILIRSTIYATTAVVHEGFDAERVIAALDRDRVTLVSLVPTTLARLLDAGLADSPKLRCALIGGAPAPPALLERARTAGVPVSQTYGLTEACSQVTTQPPGDGHDDAGPPLFCTRLQIAPDGEILVHGPTVAGGGWLATGDLGELRAGRLTVTGRKSELIVTGGENVAPAEVEAVLAEHPAVREAAVVGVPDDRWGEAVHAIVVLAGEASPEQLRGYCAARLAAFKVPKAFVVTDGPLPRTASGKLRRNALR